MKSINNHPLIKKLLSLELPKNDYAIFGSFPLYVCGLKEYVEDIDVLARGEAWESDKII